MRSPLLPVAATLIGVFAFGPGLIAGSNFDGLSWTDRPISLAVDVSGADASKGSANAATLFAAIAAAAAKWNAVLHHPLFQVAPARLDGGKDPGSHLYFSVTISPTQTFGSQFGFSQIHRDSAGRLQPSDLVFNPVHRWLSYHGPLAHESNGDRVPDLYRVALHEFGHLLGLAHPASDDAITIMRSRMSDVDDLTPDDIRDGEAVARFLWAQNAPRFLLPRRADSLTRNRSFAIRGTATPFFVPTMIVKIDASGETQRRILSVGRSWSHRITLEPGRNRLRFYYRGPFGDLQRFAVKTVILRP